jgi:hypothetical protein
MDLMTSRPTNSAGEHALSGGGGEEIELEKTVFVNASNWPMGPLASRYGDRMRSMFGGPGFQPVVVDLKE